MIGKDIKTRLKEVVNFHTEFVKQKFKKVEDGDDSPKLKSSLDDLIAYFAQTSSFDPKTILAIFDFCVTASNTFPSYPSLMESYKRLLEHCFREVPANISAILQKKEYQSQDFIERFLVMLHLVSDEIKLYFLNYLTISDPKKTAEIIDFFFITLLSFDLNHLMVGELKNHHLMTQKYFVLKLESLQNVLIRKIFSFDFINDCSTNPSTDFYVISVDLIDWKVDINLEDMSSILYLHSFANRMIETYKSVDVITFKQFFKSFLQNIPLNDLAKSSSFKVGKSNIQRTIGNKAQNYFDKFPKASVLKTTNNFFKVLYLIRTFVSVEANDIECGLFSFIDYTNHLFAIFFTLKTQEILDDQIMAKLIEFLSVFEFRWRQFFESADHHIESMTTEFSKVLNVFLRHLKSINDFEPLWTENLYKTIMSTIFDEKYLPRLHSFSFDGCEHIFDSKLTSLAFMDFETPFVNYLSLLEKNSTADNDKILLRIVLSFAIQLREQNGVNTQLVNLFVEYVKQSSNKVNFISCLSFLLKFQKEFPDSTVTEQTKQRIKTIQETLDTHSVNLTDAYLMLSRIDSGQSFENRDATVTSSNSENFNFIVEYKLNQLFLSPEIITMLDDSASFIPYEFSFCYNSRTDLIMNSNGRGFALNSDYFQIIGELDIKRNYLRLANSITDINMNLKKIYTDRKIYEHLPGQKIPDRNKFDNFDKAFTYQNQILGAAVIDNTLDKARSDQRLDRTATPEKPVEPLNNMFHLLRNSRATDFEFLRRKPRKSNKFYKIITHSLVASSLAEEAKTTMTSVGLDPGQRITEYMISVKIIESQETGSFKIYQFSFNQFLLFRSLTGEITKSNVLLVVVDKDCESLLKNEPYSKAKYIVVVKLGEQLNEIYVKKGSVLHSIFYIKSLLVDKRLTVSFIHKICEYLFNQNRIFETQNSKVQTISHESKDKKIINHFINLLTS
jgi:hypothetical protein